VRFVIPVFFLVLCACTAPIKMRNAATGQVATCGPYKETGLGTPEREAQCISDFQRQGYERAPD